MRLKLADHDAGKFTFRLDTAERGWFQHLLGLYPLCESPVRAPTEDARRNRLIEKALAEQRARLHERAQIFSRAGALEIDRDFNEYWDITLTSEEIEELLQIFNNVRIGAWVQLGKPAPTHPSELKTDDEETVRQHVVMHICAIWENALMLAANPALGGS